MSNPRQHPSTYFVQDRMSIDERDRLTVQDQMLTAGMGGVLPEFSEPGRLQHVLDVACGTGGWLIELARTYPDIPLLIGVDISEKLIEYAQMKAEEYNLSDRVQFRSMDALRMLEFPTNFFDLVNQRLGFSYLRTWDWPKLLREFQRVARPGGVIRLTEANIKPHMESEALNRLFDLQTQAFHQGGYLFDLDSQSVINNLERLLRQYGLTNIQSRQHVIKHDTSTEKGQAFVEDVTRAFRVMVPFLKKWIRIPNDYEEIYQQAIQDMKQPGFVVNASMLTAWGYKKDSN